MKFKVNDLVVAVNGFEDPFAPGYYIELAPGETGKVIVVGEYPSYDEPVVGVQLITNKVILMPVDMAPMFWRKAH